MMDFPDLSKGGELIIRNGDFVIEGGDFAVHDQVEIPIDLYHFLARTNLDQARQHEERFKPGIATTHSDLHGDLLRELTKWLEQWTVPAVIYSALCIEALLNYYGVNRLGTAAFTSALERRPVIDKLKLLPNIVLGRNPQATPPTVLLDALKKVFRQRHELAHFKTKVVSQKVIIPAHRITVTDATVALALTSEVCDYLRSVDPGFSFTFSSERETEAYQNDYASTLRWGLMFTEQIAGLERGRN